MTTVLTLLVNMLVIPVGVKLFRNRVDWLGKKFNFGDGSVGSILAAVGTALPKTVVPVIAIDFGTRQDTEDIGMATIIGSSFMLATLALGNITGAMIFQPCILPAIGILLSPWKLPTLSLVAARVGLMSTGGAYVQLRVRGTLQYRHLIGMGILYLGFAAYAVTISI